MLPKKLTFRNICTIQIEPFLHCLKKPHCHTSFGPSKQCGFLFWFPTFFFVFFNHNVASCAQDTNANAAKTGRNNVDLEMCAHRLFFLHLTSLRKLRLILNSVQWFGIACFQHQFQPLLTACEQPARCRRELCERVAQVYHTANKLRQGTMRLLSGPTENNHRQTLPQLFGRASAAQSLQPLLHLGHIVFIVGHGR